MRGCMRIVGFANDCLGRHFGAPPIPL
jgi:hypothetical protein